MSTDYIAVLPDGIDGAQSYLRLPHPRTGAPQLYLSAPGGMYEVVKVSGAHGRTWFAGENLSQGSVLVHHPIDPLFLAIPLALSLIDGRATFQPLADLLANAASSDTWNLKPAFAPTAEPAFNPDVGVLVENKNFRRAFRACCDKKVVQAAQEDEKPTKYYRPSRDAILKHLKAKVDALACEKNFNKFDHLVRALGREGLLDASADAVIVQAARSQAAIDHVANFLPTTMTQDLTDSYDLKGYHAYQTDRIAAARAAEAPVVKPTKVGDKRKLGKTASSTSRGVEALKKVNTNGMAKMTSFFKPKEKAEPKEKEASGGKVKVAA